MSKKEIGEEIGNKLCRYVIHAPPFVRFSPAGLGALAGSMRAEFAFKRKQDVIEALKKAIAELENFPTPLVPAGVSAPPGQKKPIDEMARAAGMDPEKLKALLKESERKTAEANARATAVHIKEPVPPLGQPKKTTHGKNEKPKNPKLSIEEVASATGMTPENLRSLLKESEKKTSEADDKAAIVPMLERQGISPNMTPNQAAFTLKAEEGENIVNGNEANDEVQSKT